MTPESAISALDRALAVSGEDVVIRRATGTQLIPLDCNCRGLVNGYSPQELVGEITQGDSRVILSPTEMQARQWTWPPRVNDRLIVGGKLKTVMAVDPISMGGQLVRIEMRVRG